MLKNIAISAAVAVAVVALVFRVPALKAAVAGAKAA
jgi:hypothetical protein